MLNNSNLQNLLEMNCDFSSNNNFGVGFMSFCGGHFEFGWAIFIMTDWFEFRIWGF